MDSEELENRQPAFKPEEYFQGRTQAWGMFEDRFGDVRRQFTVDIDGTWDGTVLTLVEDFDYHDGETERRTWRIRRTGEDTYEGQADGVVGIATGKRHGNVLTWAYDFDLKIGDSTWRVHFDDRMLLQQDGILLNRAVVSKLGITLGVATIAFKKQENSSSANGPGITRALAAAE